MTEYFVIIDIETTGFNPFHDEIIEIAASDSFGNKYSSLIKITKPLPPKIKEITKITDEMLSTGINIRKALMDLNIFLLKHSEIDNKYIIGHNLLNFDLPFLSAKFRKYRLTNMLDCYNKLDTLRMSQYILPERFSHSMHSLCVFYNLTNPAEHRAMGDVLTLAIILEKLKREYKDRQGIEGMNNIFDTIQMTSKKP